VESLIILRFGPSNLLTFIYEALYSKFMHLTQYAPIFGGRVYAILVCVRPDI
jgi:hypothetical protein